MPARADVHFNLPLANGIRSESRAARDHSMLIFVTRPTVHGTTMQ